jgi:DNA-binding winged helix-turn-helix (wHTH) protein/tetratricopeptide (TPR) repeat protein
MKPAEQGAERRSVFRVGAVQFDEAKAELLVDGVRRAIEAKPLALLLALLTRAGALATKRELIEAVWGNADHISEASLTTAMFKLRTALGEKGRDIIDVVHGSGYRITQPVEVTASRDRALAFSFRPGDTVPGRPQWRLDQLLGSPALNDVWLARHQKTREARVFKFADSAARLETLQREATLSRVLHATLGARDDLVRIAEWNFDERPYFIESAYGGPDLPAWASARGGLAAVALEARLAMVAQIARTLAAAHAAGVLHSDIKPANILVAEPEAAIPRLRLVDFGAGGLNGGMRLDAMAISMNGLEREAHERGTGTLRYMAPEVLAGGAPTTGADIYALGILLYQLVIGDLTRSLTIGWETGIADGLLREDIAHAASGDPAMRLDSAASLAERLETLPARHAARAREQQAADAAARQARQLERARLRRPWVIAAALSMAAGVAVSTLFGVRALHDRDEARRRADIAQAVNAFLTEDLLGRGNPAKSGKADETLMDAAQAAEAGIDARLAGEPLVAGSIYLSLARAFDARSAFDASRTAYERAVAAFNRAGAAGHDEAVLARLHQAAMEVLSGAPGSMARAQKIIADTRPLVEGLGARKPEARIWLAYGSAMTLMLGGDVQTAQAEFRQAAEQADTMPGVFDENTRLLLHQRLAFTYVRQSNWAVADPMIAALLQRRLTLNGPRHPATLQLELNQAQSRIAQGQSALALTELTRIYPDFVSVFGTDHLLTMELLATRAQGYVELQRYDDAVADQMTIYRLVTRKQGTKSFFALGTLSDAGQELCRGGKADEGLKATQSAYDDTRANFGPTSALTQIASVDLAFCLIMAGKQPQAAPLLTGIDTKATGDFEIDPAYGDEVDLMRADIALAAGDTASADALLAKAAPVFEAPHADLFMRAWARRLVAARK